LGHNFLTWAMPQRFAYFLHCGFLSRQAPATGAFGAAAGVLAAGLAGAVVDVAAPAHHPHVILHFCIIIFLYFGALQYFFKLGHCFGVLSLHSPAGAAPAAEGALVVGAVAAPPVVAPGQSLHVLAQLLVNLALYRGALQYLAYLPQPGILSLQTGAGAAAAVWAVLIATVGATDVGAAVAGASVGSSA
jgi:hypothetical protein